MATITPTVDKQGSDTTIFWETLTQDDTAAAAQWGGGEGYFSAYGTFGAATMYIEVSVDGGTTYFRPDTDGAPDGGKFTSAGMVKIDLPVCMIKPTFSGGSGQDIDVKISPKRSI